MTAPKRPRDPNALAKSIVDIATGQASDVPVPRTPVQEFARKGGLKGGKTRAEKLSPNRRKEIAKKAAETRWKKKEGAD